MYVGTNFKKDNTVEIKTIKIELYFYSFNLHSIIFFKISSNIHTYSLFFNIRFIKIFFCIKKGGNKFPLLNVCLTIYLPILFTAALDFSRISPFKGTNPSDGALS